MEDGQADRGGPSSQRMEPASSSRASSRRRRSTTSQRGGEDVGVEGERAPLSVRRKSKQREGWTVTGASFSYVTSDEQVSPWIKCAICLAPFLDPQTSTACQHTFCKACITRALEPSSVQHYGTLEARSTDQEITAQIAPPLSSNCPTCRAAVQLGTFQPSSSIVKHIVDSLRVKCPHRRRGCQHTCERQFLRSHMLRDCGFAYIGEYEGSEKQERGRLGGGRFGSGEGEADQDPEASARSTLSSSSGEESESNLSSHPSALPHAIKSPHCICGTKVLLKDLQEHKSSGSCTKTWLYCSSCHTRLLQGQADSHASQCPSSEIQCKFCQETLIRRDLTSHLKDKCPEVEVGCTHAEFGCAWRARRADLLEHVEERCKIAALSSFLEVYKAQMGEMRRENEMLRRRVDFAEKGLEGCVSALGEWFEPISGVSGRTDREYPEEGRRAEQIDGQSTPSDIDRILADSERRSEYTAASVTLGSRRPSMRSTVSVGAKSENQSTGSGVKVSARSADVDVAVTTASSSSTSGRKRSGTSVEASSAEQDGRPSAASMIPIAQSLTFPSSTSEAQQLPTRTWDAIFPDQSVPTAIAAGPPRTLSTHLATLQKTLSSLWTRLVSLSQTTEDLQMSSLSKDVEHERMQEEVAGLKGVVLGVRMQVQGLALVLQEQQQLALQYQHQQQQQQMKLNGFSVGEASGAVGASDPTSSAASASITAGSAPFHPMQQHPFNLFNLNMPNLALTNPYLLHPLGSPLLSPGLGGGPASGPPQLNQHPPALQHPSIPPTFGRRWGGLEGTKL